MLETKLKLIDNKYPSISVFLASVQQIARIYGNKTCVQFFFTELQVRPIFYIHASLCYNLTRFEPLVCVCVGGGGGDEASV